MGFEVHGAERDVGARIRDSVARVELDAVDDAEPRALEVHVLEAQVAVTVAHAACGDANAKQARVTAKERSLACFGLVCEAAPHEEGNAVAGLREILVDVALDGRPRCPAFRLVALDLAACVQLRHDLRHAIHIGRTELAGGEHRVRTTRVAQSDHPHCPIDDGPLPPDHDPPPRPLDHRHHPDVDVRRQARVQTRFVDTGSAPPIERAEVEKAQVDRLLDLEYLTLAAEHPRDMGLDQFHLGRPWLGPGFGGEEIVGEHRSRDLVTGSVHAQLLLPSIAANRQDRARRHPNDLLRDTAEQHASDAAPPVRTHDDEVDLRFLGERNDLVPGQPVAKGDSEVDTGPAHMARYALESRSGGVLDLGRHLGRDPWTVWEAVDRDLVRMH